MAVEMKDEKPKKHKEADAKDGDTAGLAIEAFKSVIPDTGLVRQPGQKQLGCDVKQHDQANRLKQP